MKPYEKIKQYRKNLRMTQEEFALLTGYTDRSSIAKIEKGEIDFPQSKIERFAETLGITPTHLMGWDNESENLAAMTAQVLKDPNTLQVVQDYMSLDEEDKAAVRALVASLASKKKKG